ncbi:hypothetical protein Lser_V15G07136 [Lactuca serriola]
MDLQQKAKVKWLTDGDENTTFFHCSVKRKNRKNQIHGLHINGVWCTDPEEIKKEVHDFFASKFHDAWPNRPKLISHLFKTLSAENVVLLDAPFTFEEVKQAIWSYGGEKASGPDGYTFKILKSKWDLIKADIFRFMKHFESHGSLARGCNSSFISLISKVKDPLHLGDYIPINLIGCLYKIIAKLMASRLKLVIGSVINEVQSTYIIGRYILDGPLIINEVCSWAKQSKELSFCLRLISKKPLILSIGAFLIR